MTTRTAFPLLALIMVGGCGGGDATLSTSPELRPALRPAAAEAMAESFPRSGDLHVIKECSQYTRLAGGFCTITSSSLEQIEVGTRVVYTSAAGAGVIDSDVTLDPPGPGSNRAFGHCRLEFATGRGLCTFDGGTGKFTWFQASVAVTSLGRPNWGWDGEYSFDPRS
jgi:hypothetical protein